MNQSQIHQLEMMQATNDYLDTHTGTWSVIPKIATYKNQLAQAIDDIRVSSVDNEATKVFVGTTMEHLKIQIAEKMDILDDTLEAYAEDTKNSELIFLASNSKSDYLELSDEDFQTKVKSVIELLETHLPAMGGYGLNKQQIDDAKLTFDSYLSRIGIPRSYPNLSRDIQNVDILINEANETLLNLDKVMIRFKRSNASFYHGYEMVRSMIDNMLVQDRRAKV